MTLRFDELNNLFLDKETKQNKPKKNIIYLDIDKMA